MRQYSSTTFFLYGLGARFPWPSLATATAINTVAILILRPTSVALIEAVKWTVSITSHNHFCNAAYPNYHWEVITNITLQYYERT